MKRDSILENGQHRNCWQASLARTKKMFLKMKGQKRILFFFFFFFFKLLTRGGTPRVGFSPPVRLSESRGHLGHPARSSSRSRPPVGAGSSARLEAPLRAARCRPASAPAPVAHWSRSAGLAATVCCCVPVFRREPEPRGTSVASPHSPRGRREVQI